MQGRHLKGDTRWINNIINYICNEKITSMLYFFGCQKGIGQGGVADFESGVH